MKCIVCKVGETYSSRTADFDDRIEHKRTCLGCGVTFDTVQIPAMEYRLLKSKADNFQTMISGDARDRARRLIDNGGLR